MIDENKSLVVDSSEIDSKITDLAKQILDEPDPERAKQAVALFNWNISKKNTTRILKLNSLYDDVTDQMVLRFKTKSDQFSNSDLLDYMKAVQGAIDTSTKHLEAVEESPTIIQQHNTQVNINVVDGFDRESRERILAAIQETLHRAESISNNSDDIVVEDVTPDNDVASALKELDSITEERKDV